MKSKRSGIQMFAAGAAMLLLCCACGAPAVGPGTSDPKQTGSTGTTGADSLSTEAISTQATTIQSESSEVTTTTTRKPTTTTTTRKPTTTTTTTKNETTTSTQSATTRTKTFGETYAEDTLIVWIKEGFVDQEKEYSREDFPELDRFDIKEIKELYFEKQNMQAVYIVFNQKSEQMLKEVKEILLQNPMVEAVDFDGIDHPD